MAVTQIADIIKPEPLFLDSVVERTAELSEIFQSGMVQRDPMFDELARGKGSIFDMPFWNDLSTGSSVLSDSSSLTPKKLTQSKDRAVKHFRGDSWQSNDLAGILAGDNPQERVRDMLADYWARDMQSEILVPSLTGIFATALASTHVNDVAIEDGDNAAESNLVSSDNIIDTAKLLGDAWKRVRAIVVHSVVHARMQKLGLIETEQLQDQDISVETFLGRRVIEDDGVPVVAGGTSGNKYTTYLFGPNAIGFGDGSDALDDNSGAMALETDRDSLAGNSILISRRQFIMHPRGVQFSGSPSGASPTKTELENGANWTKAWEDKNIVLLKLVTNG